MPAASAVAGTATAAQRPERRARPRPIAAVATVGTSHGDAPRARRTRPRGAEEWLCGMEDLRSGGYAARCFVGTAAFQDGIGWDPQLGKREGESMAGKR